MVNMSVKDKNLGVVAVCDIWKNNKVKAAARCKKLFGNDVAQFTYSEDMLEMKDLDAVMIATGDFQHAKILAEVVHAGKDCYCEKPMAESVEEAKLARNTVLASKQVVQMGSQWVSDPVQLKVREIVRSGKLGQITKIEQVWNDNDHRWHVPNDPDVLSIREEDTDWNRWLHGKPYEPYDPWKYFEFRIFRNYSGGITSQWMSHGIGLVHFYTDTAIPDSMVANGGIFGWPDIRQNPDTLQALATYDDAKFLYSYTPNYANKFGDYTCIRGKDATLFAQGGEGSPRWFFIPEYQDLPGGFDFYLGIKDAVESGKAEMITSPEYENKLPPTRISDDSKLDKPVKKGFSTDLFADATIGFLDNYAKGTHEKPFLCYVAFTVPHDPRSPREDYIGMYPDESIPIPGNFKKLHPFEFDNLNGRDETLAPWPRTPEIISASLADYYALISHVDKRVGDILETLKKEGLFENTIIVYAADNGLAIGSHGLLGKQNLYEHSMKVPLIFSGPGIPRNKVCEALVYLYDIFPTLANLCGLPVPEGIDGKDFVPVLTGKEKTVRSSLYTAYRNTARTVRTDEWKLIRYPQRDYTQLFNLKKYPLEIYNLAELPEYKSRLDEMMKLMDEWYTATGDTATMQPETILPLEYDYHKLKQTLIVISLNTF